MRVVLKRAKYFITCNGRVYERYNPNTLSLRLKEGTDYQQLNLFDDAPLALPMVGI